MTFAKLRTRNIPVMQAEVQEYEDPATGARHIHLATNDPDMVFMVGFPTVPDVSDGRAHILEHLALCGSARYPVRDPFFSMLRRSTAHFMNAMTYADKTVYPFASTDKTDYFNLLDVYLDAVFFPRLDYLDFLQEGWRLALDGDKLAYHGVVFNEMKGAFADPMRALDSGIASQLLKGTTYEVESGGDPLDIPSLTHAALKEFHATHYHPSQAVFMTAGSIDPLEVQSVIEQRVLSKLSGRAPRMLPKLAPTWTAPKQATVNIPGREHGIQISWLMGESVDLAARYEAELLDVGLLGNAAAPLMRAMESAGFGRPGAINGIDANGRQMVFHLGMEGLTEQQVGEARKRIWAALEQAAQEGVPQSVLQAALRDTRFRQREITPGSTPYLLKRLLRAIPHEMYGGDIMDGFDREQVIAQLQQEISDPAYFKRLVRALLDSPTRLDTTVVPDADYFTRRKAIEDERLAALQASLAESEKERVRAEAAALLERQRQPVNNDILPRIHSQDVSQLPRPAFPLPEPENGVIAVSIPSNGISYARVMYDVSGMEEAAWPWLQLYAELVPELGVGDKSYEEADAWRHEQVAYFDINVHTCQTQDPEKSLRIHMDFFAKGLREENKAIAGLVAESISAPRFDEYERLAFLIDSSMQDTLNALADEGDSYARHSAAAPVSPLDRFDDHTGGTSSLAFYRDLHRQSESEEGLREISRRLSEIHHRIVNSPRTVIVAGVEQDSRELAQSLDLPPVAVIPQGSASPQVSEVAAGKAAFSNAALHASGQVNHCFAVWPAPGFDHADAPKLAVLGELLTNRVLHQALREEGGAYGGQAAYSKTNGKFVMTTYRDPRLSATYKDFEQAISWLMDAELKQDNVEEAIICAIQELDKPLTPFAGVMWAWDQQQQGITEEMRRRFRHGVLHCTAQDMKAAAETWLQGKPYSRAAFVGNVEQDLAGLELVDLMKLAC